MLDLITCPTCGAVIEREYYVDDLRLTEEYAECDCGWKLGWAYGIDLLKDEVVRNN